METIEVPAGNPTVLALEKIAVALKVPAAKLLEETPRRKKLR